MYILLVTLIIKNIVEMNLKIYCINKKLILRKGVKKEKLQK